MNGYYTAIIILSWLALGVLCILVYENSWIPRAKKWPFYLAFCLIALSALTEWIGVHFDGNPDVSSKMLLIVKCADYTLTPIFTACANWDVFFDQLLDYGIRTRCTIFFDDAALRNDKDEFLKQLQRVLEQNQEFSFFVVFLLKPWETLPLRAHTKTLLPMSPASLRRTMGLKDEDTFRLFTLTDGNPHLIGQYNCELSFEDNVRAWLRCDSRFYHLAREWMDCCFRSPEGYNTLMHGMATSLNRVSELSELSGFPMNKVDKYLKALAEHGLITCEKEAGSHTRYIPANNYLTLWYRYLFASGLTSEGSFPEQTVAAFMDDLDNVLVPATFRKTVLQWLSWHQGKFVRKHIDIRAPYMKDVWGNGVHFDYIYKTDERTSRYLVVKLFDHLNERCRKNDWQAIDNAVSSVVPYYESTLILASIHRFSDYCWEITSTQHNAKLVQIQTLNRVSFNHSLEREQLKRARS